jgi:aspartyl protease family protein
VLLAVTVVVLGMTQDKGQGEVRNLADLQQRLVGLKDGAMGMLPPQLAPPDSNVPLAAPAPGAGPSVTLQEAPAGGYYTQGSINGTTVTFHVDTGASLVVVPQRIAARAGLAQGTAARATTANGETTTYATTIPVLRLGDIKLHEVRAAISPTLQGSHVLLGMSALRGLHIRQGGGTMTLSTGGATGGPGAVTPPLPTDRLARERLRQCMGPDKTMDDDTVKCLSAPWSR